MKRILPILIVAFLLPSATHAQPVSTEESGEVDIIIEADTLVPVFYAGRAEPASGSLVRAIAVARTTDAATYAWMVNGKTVQGSDVIEFTAPTGNEFFINVTVYDQEGGQIGTDERYVHLSDPETYVYETNLLRGVTPLAISATHILVGDELNVRVEPYFFDSATFAPQFISWFVDGKTVAASSEDGQTLSLRRGAESGSALIEFTLQNLRNFGQSANNRFTIQF